MAAKQLSEVVKDVLDGEDSDTAYARLYADQVKPCDFRRWFAQVSRDKTSPEVSKEMLKSLETYIAEKMTVDEAFKAHEPNYIGPGEFLTAYVREMKTRKERTATLHGSERKSVKKRPDAAMGDTVLPEGVTLI
jgi:hypothetical protein